MIKQIAHYSIRSPDLELTKRFYTEALGMELGFTFEKKGELFGFYIKAGNQTFVEVFKGEPGDTGNIHHVAMEVTDLDGLTERIRSAGFEVGEKSMGADHTWQAWTTDPGGTRIELHEYTDASLQCVGGTCIVDW